MAPLCATFMFTSPLSTRPTAYNFSANSYSMARAGGCQWLFWLFSAFFQPLESLEKFQNFCSKSLDNQYFGSINLLSSTYFGTFYTKIQFYNVKCTGSMKKKTLRNFLKSFWGFASFDVYSHAVIDLFGPDNECWTVIWLIYSLLLSFLC